MGATIATNKKAFRDFDITEKWECGLELIGAEVKSMRAGNVNFKDSFARVDNGQVFLYSLHIENYAEASYMNEGADRTRRLLLHKSEIRKITKKMNESSAALVPTKIYFNSRGFVKVEIGMGKGRKMHDKRVMVKKREINRDIDRQMKSRR
ncbi:MAG: SsrA-binding protein [Candidatus Omnitrophota bacterium]|jgi:SsrA-binding protein